MKNRAQKRAEAASKRQKEEPPQEEQQQATQKKIATFSEYVNKVYLPTVEVMCNNLNTLTSKKGVLKNHLMPEFGDMQLDQITGADVQNFIIDSLNGYKRSTVKLWRTFLSAIFTDAMNRGVIESNPCERTTLPKETVSADNMEEEHKWFTDDEMTYIWECAAKEDLRTQMEISLMYWTGCRQGELTVLRWKDVNWTAKEITIAHSGTNVTGQGVVVGPTKSGRTRVASVPEEVINLLKAYRKEQGVLSEYIFPNMADRSKPMQYGTAYRDLKRMGKKYGIEDIHPHKFRHTFASQAVQNGAAITDVAAALGHSGIATAQQYYIHSDSSASKRVLEKLRQAN